MKKRNLGKWIIAIALTIAVACSTKVGVENVLAAVDDVSNEAGSAAAITIGTAKIGYMNSKEDVDIFKFSTDGTDSFYQIAFKNVNSNRIRYAIYEDADLTEKFLEYYIDEGRNTAHNLVKLTKNSTYYVKVWNDGGDVSEGKYQIEVTKVVDDVKDTSNEATSFAVGKSQTGYMNNDKDVDYFKFATDGTDSFYHISFKNVNSNRVRYIIYEDEDLTQRVLEYYVDEGRVQTHNLVKLSKKATYYIQVWNDGGDITKGEYQIEVTKVVDDVKDTSAEATNFSVGKDKTAYLNNNSDTDFFKFKTDKTDSFYKITFKNIDANRVRYIVYEDKDLTKKVLEYYVDKGGSNTHNLVKLSKNKTYYVQVWNDGGDITKGKYKLAVKKTKDDVQDTVAKAKSLKLNSVYSSYKLQNESDVDFFKVKTSNYKDYTLSFANLSKKGRIWIEVYSGKDCLDNQKIVNTYCDAKGSINSTIAKLKLGYNKTYYIKISGAEDSKYKVGLSATPPQSVKAKKANTGSKKKVTLTWKKVNRATGYEIYRATSKNGKYTKVATIGKAGTLKYTDGKNLKKGKIYYYKIRAYRKTSKGKIYSAYSSIKSIKIK